MGIVGNVLLMSCSILITVTNNFIFLIFKSYPKALYVQQKQKQKNKNEKKYEKIALLISISIKFVHETYNFTT